MRERENQDVILKYFKNGCLSKGDILLASLLKTIPYRLRAKQISGIFSRENFMPSPDSTAVTIQIPKYSGSNPCALQLKKFIEEKLSSHLIGAYAHGSVGTGEEVAYSDFDGFVIIKNTSLSDPKKLENVAFLLNESEKIMTAMDPLQHHGWFILTENDLKDYPEHYLPHQLWEYAKTLFGDTKLTVHVNTKMDSSGYLKAYSKFSVHLMRNIKSLNFLRNNYDLKSVLSGFMLLPSIYLQAKNGKGVFKKHSFEALKNEIGQEYDIMDEVSAIRKNWHYRPSKLYKKILWRKPFLLSYLFKKRLSGKPSVELMQQLNPRFISRMKSLIQTLDSKIK